MLPGINLYNTEFTVIIKTYLLLSYSSTFFSETWSVEGMQETRCHAQEIYVTEGLSYVMFPVVTINDSGVDGFRKAP